MRVAIDSNVICKDFLLTGALSRVFFDGLAVTGHSLYVPQLVIDEVTNKYSERLAICQTKIDKEIRSIERLTTQTLLSPISNDRRQEMARKYREVLKNRLSEAGAAIVKYPTVSHRTVVHRSLSRRWPFDTKDSGYRDYLIWMTIIKLARQKKDPIAFITMDKHFADEEFNLHRDLVADLIKNDLEGNSVALVRSLEEFVDRHMKPRMKKEEYIRKRLSAGPYRGINLETIILEQTVDFVGAVELDPLDIGFPEEFESPTISLVEDVSNIEVKSVLQLPSRELLVEVEADTFCEFDVFIFKSNLYVLETRGAPSISDYDWNEAYASASASEEVHLILYVTVVFFDSGKATSMELVSVSTKQTV